MNFAEWLNEATKQIAFASWSKDGGITVLIDGQRYRYWADPLFIERWKRMSVYAPGKVLNELLRQVKAGQADEIEAPTKVPAAPGSCPTCRTPPPHYSSGLECPGCGS